MARKVQDEDEVEDGEEEEDEESRALRHYYATALGYEAASASYAGRSSSGSSSIDESYLEALEWGLPPTGGWGCGIERLAMLFAGTGRIHDVLAFGTLRNVVNLG